MKKKLIFIISLVVVFNISYAQGSYRTGLLDVVELNNNKPLGLTQKGDVNTDIVALGFDGRDSFIRVPSVFNINNWNELTLQFWVKSNSIEQNSAGIIGQKGVLELSYDGHLNVKVFNQGVTGIFSNEEWINNVGTWFHVTFVYDNGTVKLYLNGKNVYDAITLTNILGTSSEDFKIGGQIKTGIPSNNFDGSIDEVRVFDVALSEDQIQQIICQEIEENEGFVKGTIIPKDIVNNSTGALLNWSSLRLYYKMGTSFIGSNTIDYSNYGLHGSLHNMSTQQIESAPMPYVTKESGDINAVNTWLNGDVWFLPNSPFFPSESAIIKVNHDVVLNNTMKTLGLFIDSGATLLVKEDNLIQNNWYLDLKGTIDLEGDSQLIQTETSDLVTSSNGNILRRQEGTSNAYWYNYWASPVGATNATSLVNNNTSLNNTNNTSFVLYTLKDDSGFSCPFTSNYTGNGSVSVYWLKTFKGGLSHIDWFRFSVFSGIEPGIGYTQKGTGVAAPEQQYIFDGKPNNGTIVIPVIDTGGVGSEPSVSRTEYLLGNPYASALDVYKFIDDNEGVIDGTLRLWQHWSGDSHHLIDGNGGYAEVNKTGGVRAFQFVEEEKHITSQAGVKVPARYLSVAQGFMVEVVADGEVKFNNAQRVFVKESNTNDEHINGSVFFKGNSKKAKGNSTEKKNEKDDFKRVRLDFKALSGPEAHRELLLGFSSVTADSYDYGYDAENIGNGGSNDLHLNLDGKDMNIQAYGELTHNKVVSLNFKSSGSHSFEIRVSETENLETSEEIYLRDNNTGSYFDLTEGATYHFSSDQGEFNTRFELVFESEEVSLTDKETEQVDDFIYYQNNVRKLYGKKLNSDVERLTIVNILGQTVFKLQNVSRESLNHGVNIPRVAAGSYIAYFQTRDNKVYSKKMIIN